MKKSVLGAVIVALLVGAGATAAQAAPRDDVVALVNQQRTVASLPPLARDASLDAAAQEWAEQMRSTGQFAHSTNAWRAARIPAGWRSHGENIAYGYPTAQAVMTGWMNSKGHRENILRDGYTRIGVGYVASGNYWVQIFAGYVEAPQISPAPTGRTGGSALVGAPLSAVVGAWKAGTALSYQWYVGDRPIPGATGAKFTPTPDLAGARVAVAVTGRLSGHSATVRMSTPSGVIQALKAIAPAPVGSVGGSAKAGAPLSARPGTWASRASLSYQWHVNGAPVPGATGPKFTPSDAHIGGRATVAVTGTLSGFAPTMRMSTPSGIIQPPLPSIDPAPVGRPAGSARAGLPLTAVPGAWKAGTALSYQWYVNGVAVPGATGVKFVPGADHSGGRASVAVTGTLAGHLPTTRMSTSSGVVQPGLAPVAPAPVGRPAGSARAGLPLTAVPGVWATGAALSYQWSVNGVAVAGATQPKYVPTDAQVGGRATVTVTGTLAGFAPTARVSTASGVIQPR